jgi:hypothetical protein
MLSIVCYLYFIVHIRLFGLYIVTIPATVKNQAQIIDKKRRPSIVVIRPTSDDKCYIMHVKEQLKSIYQLRLSGPVREYSYIRDWVVEVSLGNLVTGDRL